MRVAEINLTTADDCRLEAHAVPAGNQEPLKIWFRFPLSCAPFLSDQDGDPFLAAFLLPAMASGESLEIPAPVSPKLLEAAEQIQSIYHCWDPSLSPVEIIAPLRNSVPRPHPDQNAVFFSGGVDSFYSLLKNHRRHADDTNTIRALIMIHGFDVFHDELNANVFPEMLTHASLVADKLGKEVLPVSTNLREVTDKFVYWGGIGYGSNLASLGLSLQSLFRRIFIAASNTYADLSPAGSHPILDPLWSTETLTFVHDGCEVTRHEKTGEIAQNQIALDNLRVCATLGEQLNCGKCDKCLLTMVSLEMHGALQNCKTLPPSIDLGRLRTLPVKSASRKTFVLQLIRALEESAAHAELREALATALENADENWSERVVADRQWTQTLLHLKDDIADTMPEGCSFVLCDADSFPKSSFAGRTALPFLERDGRCLSPPEDSETAIRELAKLLAESSPEFLVIPCTAFWWLDYYTDFVGYLDDRFPVVKKTERTIAFDLRQSQSG